MKTAMLVPCISVTLFVVSSIEAQGTFQNLDFEQANPVPIVGSPFYPYAVTFASALPGWNGAINGVPVTQVIFNTYSLGSASIDIFGPGWNNNQPGIIDGNSTVFLQAFNVGQGNVSIWQDGTLPANAESLQFSAWSFPNGPGHFTVSFAGNNLSPVPLYSTISPSGQPYTVYGANIGAYAGQTGELEFTSIAGASWNEFDDISFSPAPVTPEPNPLILTGIGALVFALYRRFAPKPR
jgi:hypothetical protein